MVRFPGAAPAGLWSLVGPCRLHSISIYSLAVMPGMAATRAARARFYIWLVSGPLLALYLQEL